MGTQWEHMLFVFCSPGSLQDAISALDLAYPRDDGIPRDTGLSSEFGPGFGESPSGPIQFYGVAIVATEEIRALLESTGIGSNSGVKYWRTTNPGGLLVTTNHQPSVESIGLPWGWKDCVSSLGLVAVE